LQDEVLILGGGVAGCAASIALARTGRSVTLIEREPTPRHKVCGEFLSGEALEDLHALGIDVASLGAVPINYVRLAAARRAAEAPLPFPAASLTRRALDTALIAEAIAAGVRLKRGRSVQSLSRSTGNLWQATLDDGTAAHISGTIVVAAGSGKTGNDSRDKKMNKDILKVNQYTTVSFAPKTYKGTIPASGDSTIQVSGVFTLLGMPHDLTIPMHIHIDGSKATAKAQFVVPYVQWGLKNPSFLIWKAENDVAIDLNLVGQISN
jgi:flavin-dependent dehydrogenase